MSDLRVAGLGAIVETARRLRIAPAHLIFGHTHRPGRLDGDPVAEWRTPDRTQLHNPGSWLFDTAFMRRGPDPASPYWPGGAIALDGAGPPRLERLLGGVPAAALQAERRS